MRFLPMGPTAVLVEDLSAAPATVASVLGDQAMPDVVEIVPAAETLLVSVSSSASLDRVIDALEHLSDLDAGSDSGRRVDIDVVYDGDDLEEVAERTNMSVDEVVARHSEAAFTVAFCGFAPGFAYLDGLPPELHVPRRPTPRTRVPAGSVAIAAGFSAVYPSASPGGWNLLGRSDITLFDVDRDPPALLVPGTHVRFVPT